MSKGYLEKIINLDENISDENEAIIDLNNKSDKWIVNQIIPLLEKQLKKYQTPEEKINYINESLQLKLSNKVLLKTKTNFNNNYKFLKKYTENLSLNENVNDNFVGNFYNELQTSDELLLISPFISKIFVNKMRLHLQSDKKQRIKIITTTFDGYSKYLDVEGLKQLANQFPERVEIKIEFVEENNKDRLHAKAYIFKRMDNFSTALIGSNNATKTGFVTGKEFSVKISEFREPEMFDDLMNEWNELWHNSKFINFHDAEKINSILKRKEQYGNIQNKIDDFSKEVIKDSDIKNNEMQIIKPREHQIEALKKIKQRIELGKNHHLLVMATGTGKTALAAFFYKEYAKEKKINPRILYIAPGKEILQQAMETFANVLNVKSFGVPFYDNLNQNIDKYDHIFGTINTIKNNIKDIRNKKFDIVIFDEAHHIKASTYKEVYESVKHKDTQILGLTATPKRTEGFDVKDYFFDGEYTIKLGLIESIERNLLSDFDYFYIKDDSVDLKGIDISSKNNDLLVERLDTKERNEFVYKTIEQYIGGNCYDVSVVLFCASKKHANDINEYLLSKNERSSVVFGDTKKELREDTITKFKNKEINYLCVVDVFNEGVDVPNIDHVFLLRPTASLIVFLQQIGRGFRKMPDKRLQIFDFINNIDMEINKNYNHFRFMQELVKENLSAKFLKFNFDDINEIVPTNSRIFFEKESYEYFKNKINNLSSNTENKLLKDALLLLQNETNDSYEEYAKFLENNFDHPFNMYGYFKKCFIKENDQKIKEINQSLTLRDISYIQNENLLIRIREILKTGNPDINKTINMFLIVTLFSSADAMNLFIKRHNINKINDIFKIKELSHLKREMIYLINYKLENSDLIKNKIINNSIESWIGDNFNTKQMAVVTENVKEENNKFSAFSGGHLVSGIFKAGFSNNYCIKTSYNSRDRKYNYINEYSYIKKELIWDSPENSYNDLKHAQSKKMTELKNLNKFNTYVFYADNTYSKRFKKDDGGALVFKFIGKVSEILNETKYENKNNVINFTFKIKD